MVAGLVDGVEPYGWAGAWTVPGCAAAVVPGVRGGVEFVVVELFAVVGCVTAGPVVAVVAAAGRMAVVVAGVVALGLVAAPVWVGWIKANGTWLAQASGDVEAQVRRRLQRLFPRANIEVLLMGEQPKE